MEINLKEYAGQRINGGADLFAIMREILKRDTEVFGYESHFWIVGLDDAGVLRYAELIALGDKEQENVHPMGIFSMAVTKECKRIIGVQCLNDKSLDVNGDVISLVTRIVRGAETLQMELIDYLIINEDDFVGFQEIARFLGGMEGK